jgi:hypothetical protein
MPLKYACRVGLSLLLCLATSVVLAADASAVNPAEKLAQALQENRKDLSILEGRLVGNGAARLLKSARGAQFVLVGEDHGFADVPNFVLALDRTLGTDSPENLVLEVGPFATERLRVAIAAGDLALTERRYPGSAPFVGWAEDAAMAQAWMHRGGAEALWGVDQEFLLGLLPNLEHLRTLAPDDAARALLDSLLERERRAQQEMRDRQDPSNVLMLKLVDADFNALAAAMLAAPGSEAARILAELRASADIYRDNDAAPWKSNRNRSLMMKRLFMQRYRAAQVKTPMPRALLRMGAYHTSRGLTRTGQFDIGNLASELAESNGGQSFHVLVIPAGGTVNRSLAFLADEALRAAAYDAKNELEVLGVAPLLTQAHADRWTVFDLEPLRRHRIAREAGGAEFARLVYAYDSVVVINQATAARDLLPQQGAK